jgi:hypothetical protein
MALTHHLLALLLAVAPATPAERVQTIQFARGAYSATITGAVARGERSLYALSARAGQRLTVTGQSLEQNVAFQIWRPGYKLPAAAGEDIQGYALRGAAPADDASHWSGRLPSSGRYLLVVGATRGGATYDLNIEIR